MSAIEILEQRLSAVESELALLKNQLKKTTVPWWREWMGAFQDDPYFEQAMKYGQQWRRGQKLAPRKKRRKLKQ
jgi:hypothetical protein